MLKKLYTINCFLLLTSCRPRGQHNTKNEAETEATTVRPWPQNLALRPTWPRVPMHT